jgi:MFS family permease
MTPSTGRIYYGWWVAAATFTALFIGLSSGFYTVSVFLEPLQKAFGCSRTQISAGFMAASFVSGFQSLVTGFAVSRWGVKRVQLTGALIIVLAMSCLSMMTRLYEYYLFMMLLFAGTSFVGTIPSQTVISQWFDRKRGAAMGLIMTGNGTGGMAMIFVAQKALDFWGWRTAYRVLAGLVLFVVFPMVLFVTRNRPEDMGLEKDGGRKLTDFQGFLPKQTGMTFGEALKTPAFRRICGVMILYGMVMGAMTQHAIAMLRSLGIEKPSVFWSLSLGISVGGRLVLGNMADRLPKKVLLGLCWISAAACLLSMLMIRQSHVFVAGFSVCYGLSMGSFVTLVPLFLGELYGVGHFSKIMGMAHFFLVSGISIGTVAMGRVFDLTGSYIGGLAFLLAVCGLGFFLNTTIRDS